MPAMSIADKGAILGQFGRFETLFLSILQPLFMKQRFAWLACTWAHQADSPAGPAATFAPHQLARMTARSAKVRENPAAAPVEGDAEVVPIHHASQCFARFSFPGTQGPGSLHRQYFQGDMYLPFSGGATLGNANHTVTAIILPISLLLRRASKRASMLAKTTQCLDRTAVEQSPPVNKFTTPRLGQLQCHDVMCGGQVSAGPLHHTDAFLYLVAMTS
jgi:hypothetical protein